MRLRITHRTAYAYDTPQRHVLQSRRLRPSAFDGQNVVDWRVTTEGAVIGAAFRDGAGDWIETARVSGPVDHVEVVAEGMVETRDMAGVLRGFREKVPPAAYMVSTRATRVDLGLTDLAERALSGSEPGDLSRAHALAGAVHEAIAYMPGATEAHTTAADALAQGEGVCQDHTHVLITLARIVGMPARYVTGYLFTDPEHPVEADGSPAPVSAEQESHAWAEIHIANLGWVGFDAANACCPDARYVRLCSGADAADAAPIRGLAGGSGGETLEASVRVASEPEAQSQQQQQG